MVDGGTSVIAGEKMSLTITRSGGSQGRIAVKVKTQPGTATADVDYVYANQTLVWEDGETGDKAFEIDTLDDLEAARRYIERLRDGLGTSACGPAWRALTRPGGRRWATRRRL